MVEKQSLGSDPHSDLALPLLMTGIFANDENTTATADDFAFVADSFYARSDLHDSLLPYLHLREAGQYTRINFMWASGTGKNL